jgi:glycosyltransferase involved in cell wall biosynthesis
MKNNPQLKVSAYVKGDKNTPDYYRIHQYLYRLEGEGLRTEFHEMLPAKLYHKYVPIRNHHIVIVVLLFLLVYCRTILSLLKDAIFTPDVIVINRRIMPPRALFPVWQLISYIRRKGTTRIIWDFDDDIVSLGECTSHDFKLLSDYSHHIVVTHEHLASLVIGSNRDKVTILPTTDGDMFHLYKEKEVNCRRLQTLNTGITLVWVATSSNLPFLESVIPQLDLAAQTVHRLLGKKLKLQVICNQPLVHHCQHLIIENTTWTRESAISGMLGAHIGIMPLTDCEIARGKGGFKLIQYLSVGLPCIGTDVGFNNQVIDSSCGRLVPVNQPTFWTEAIITLANTETWKTYSHNAYMVWESKFSFEKNLCAWKKMLYA